MRLTRGLSQPCGRSVDSASSVWPPLGSRKHARILLPQRTTLREPADQSGRFFRILNRGEVCILRQCMQSLYAQFPLTVCRGELKAHPSSGMGLFLFGWSVLFGCAPLPS